MATDLVRVYVYYDVEVQRFGAGGQPAIQQALNSVLNNVMQNSPTNMKREVFGVTLLPNETVVLPSDVAQVIRVKER